MKHLSIEERKLWIIAVQIAREPHDTCRMDCPDFRFFCDWIDSLCARE